MGTFSLALDSIHNYIRRLSGTCQLSARSTAQILDSQNSVRTLPETSRRHTKNVIILRWFWGPRTFVEPAQNPLRIRRFWQDSGHQIIARFTQCEEHKRREYLGDIQPPLWYSIWRGLPWWTWSTSSYTPWTRWNRCSIAISSTYCVGRWLEETFRPHGDQALTFECRAWVFVPAVSPLIVQKVC